MTSIDDPYRAKFPNTDTFGVSETINLQIYNEYLMNIFNYINYLN